MNKIQSFFKRITNRIPKPELPELTVPVAIILGSLIIAGGIVSYGFIVRPNEQEVRSMIRQVSGGLGAGAIVEDSIDFVKEVAKELNLKGSKWETCLASPAVAKQVESEFNDGAKAGVSGTPTTYVLVKKNGVYETAARIEGAQAESTVRAAIDTALSGTAQTVPFAGLQISDNEFVNGTRGNVILVEYADAECPFCIRFHPTILKVLDTYGDRVGFVYRHFPLSFHPNAVSYAVAIECAGILKKKDGYFGFIDKLFEQEAKK